MHVRKTLIHLAALPLAVVSLIAVDAAPASACAPDVSTDIEINLYEMNATDCASNPGGGGSGGVTYTKAYTGRDCATERYWNGQYWVERGTRCAQAYNEYVKSSSVLWRIDDYYIRYDVSAGLDYGPHNNERSWEVVAGYKSGDNSYNSPDAGTTNTGYFVRDPGPGQTYTYQGQTVVNIDAWPDIPGDADPRLDLDSQTF
jgi:hypothetical protein